MRTLDRDRIESQVSYNQYTGLFTWLVDKSRARRGETAGRLNPQGYVILKIDQVEIGAHRVAWFLMCGEWPTDQIDHIDRVRSNNKFANLRPATNKQNHENLPVVSSNTSGVNGVTFDHSRRRWYAHIGHHGVMRNLGRYRTKEEAIAARRAAERRFYTHAAA